MTQYDFFFNMFKNGSKMMCKLYQKNEAKSFSLATELSEEYCRKL